MAVFEHVTTLAAAPEQVFDFLTRPANLARVSTPPPHVELVESPERLAAGARFVVRIRQYGLSRLVVSRVSWFEEGRGFTDEQVDGPFRMWVHTHLVAAVPGGTAMTDRIAFAPPRGILGLFLTEARMMRLLRGQFAARGERFAAALGAGRPPT
jgi:ligand-binding SRPBCC domain-containing protein